MKKTFLTAVLLLSLFTGFSKHITPENSRLNVVSQDGKVLIQWVREESSSIELYELERSTDGKVFKTIAYIMSANEIKNYSYRDKISNQNTYYRLKQIDNVGQVSYTATKALKQNTNNEDVKIAATANGKVYIQLNHQLKQNLTVAVTALNGNAIAEYDYKSVKEIVFDAPVNVKSFVVTVKDSKNLNVSKQIVL